MELPPPRRQQAQVISPREASAIASEVRAFLRVGAMIRPERG